MLTAAYSAMMSLGLIVSAPWWLLRMVTTARYREGLPQRLGRVPPALRSAVRGRRVVWVHAVSVGEVLAVARLIEQLETALNVEPPPSQAARPVGDGRPWCLVLSTTTRTGQVLARERFGPDRVFYLPLDLRWTVRAYLHALQPCLLLLTESELWPRLLYECRRQAVPVAVVNARVSDRSFRRARRVRRLWQPVLRMVAVFLAQSDADADRLRSLGVPPERVTVTGNLKYDAAEPRPGPLVEYLRIVCAGRPVVVAGSTVEGEDELVLSAFAKVRGVVPNAVLILAPRHPERFKAVTALAQSLGAVRGSSLAPQRSKKAPGPQTSEAHPDALPPAPLPSDTSVIVLDTVGDLAAVYALADAVFVGGTLVPRGGHNPLEPARFGVPVVMGPSIENFRTVVAAMQSADGLLRIKNEEELTSALIGLLTNAERAHNLGEHGQSVFAREGGATARSIQTLMPLLSTSDPVRRRDTRAAAASGEVFV